MKARIKIWRLTKKSVKKKAGALPRVVAMGLARKDCDSPLTMMLNMQEKVPQHTGRALRFGMGVRVGVQKRENACY